MEEIWKLIPGETDYQVSNQGGVITCRCGNGKRSPTGEWRLCKQSVNSKGYPQACIDGKLRSVHKLVLEAFVGPCPPGHQACHRNDHKEENDLDNLYWGTPEQNAQDKLRNGKHNTANLTVQQAAQIKKRLATEGWSQRVGQQLLEEFPLTPSSLSAIRFGSSWNWLSDDELTT